MRIGIYTQPLRTNYGGILQAWALQTVLRRMGHEAETFDPCPYEYLSWKRKPLVHAYRMLLKLRGVKTTIHYEEQFNTEYNIKSQYLRPFISENIRRREFRSVSEFQSYNYDVLIVGSDQVWRPKYNLSYGRTIENAFLDFAKNWRVKRIAYAASFGTDEWEFTPEQTANCSCLATLFDAVSVRETSGVDLCKEHLGVEATHVLDPTMLLTSDDYVALIQKGANSIAPLGNLLCYILDESEETLSLVDSVSKERYLTPFKANFIRRGTTVEEQVQPPIEQWLRNFVEADFVITDSFHACVFSILFAKPFVVIANRERGVSRYESLLSDFNLSDHLIFAAAEYNPAKDYAVTRDAYKKLDSLRRESMQFLAGALL